MERDVRHRVQWELTVILNTMRHQQRKIRSSILLALMLIAGPLNAHVVFTCNVMEVKLYDQCCCDEHEARADRGHDNSLTTDRDSCCEGSVEMSVDHDSPEILTPIEVRFEADPTPLLALAEILTPVATTAIAPGGPHRRVSHEHGSNTYRTTERVRL